MPMPFSSPEMLSPTGCTKQLMQRGLEIGTRGGIDASAEDEAAAAARVEECLLPPVALCRRLDRRERARHAAAHRVDVPLVALGVFLEQDFLGNRLAAAARPALPNGGFWDRRVSSEIGDR